MSDLEAIKSSSEIFSELTNPYQASFYAVYKQLFPDKNASDFNGALTGFAATYDVDITNPIVFDIKNIENLNDWKQYLSAMPGALTFDNTLQTIIQTEYLVSANKAITSQMTTLDASLSLSNLAMIGFNDLTQYYNDKADPVYVQDPNNSLNIIASPQPLNNADEKYEKIFGSTLSYPDPATGAINQLNLYDFLTELKKSVDAATPISSIDPETGKGVSESSLGNVITSVIDGLHPYASSTASAFALNWGNSDNVGEHLRSGVVAAQNLNDDGKTKLKDAMWTFEEFYKSAGMIISRLLSMSQKISNRIKK